MPDLTKVASYDYDLDEDLIAQYPLADRSASRLMVIDRSEQSIRHQYFTEITSHLHGGDVLVLNTTKVFPSRLFGQKANGNPIEVLLMYEIRPQLWKCMVGGRLKRPQTVDFGDGFTGEVSDPDDDGYREIAFPQTLDFWSCIYRKGHVPLPPYIKRDDEKKDHNTYQTVYANETGSIAAPTAGFHFTDAILAQLRAQGIQICDVVLHVGPGTFKPVKVDCITDHKMHTEYCTISSESADIINAAKREGRRIIAVGTTSVRTLESFAAAEGIAAGAKWTDLFIYPGKQFQIVDAMITNFHLPRSTLLMLVSAFAGYELIRRAYAEATSLRYRFFSYGDAMLIL